MHTIVKVFVESKETNIKKVFKDYQCGDNLSKHLLEVLSVHQKDHLLNQDLQLKDITVLFEKSIVIDCELNVYVILIANWLGVFLQSFKSKTRLVNSLCHKLFRILIEVDESLIEKKVNFFRQNVLISYYIHFHQNNLARKRLQAKLKQLDKNKSEYVSSVRYYYQYGFNILQRPLIHELIELFDDVPKELQNNISPLLFIHAVDIKNFDTAFQELKKIEENYYLKSSIVRMLEWAKLWFYKSIFHWKQARFSKSELLELKTYLPPPEESNELHMCALNIFDDLYNHQIKEAKRKCDFIFQNLSGFKGPFISLRPFYEQRIRVELCEKNIIKAEEFLSVYQKTPGAIIDYFHLFKARIEYLKKEIGLAQFHFGQFVEYITLAQAPNILRCELSICHELSSYDVFVLSKNLNSEMVPQKEIEKNNIEANHETILGKTAFIQNLRVHIRKISKTKLPVLIRGETGTGKEVVARAIHFSGTCQEKPFVIVNCSAISDTLMSSELFGHVKGAFTGALNNRKGLFEEAAGGTIFLDEIGDISASMQVNLLRVIENKEIKITGSSKIKKINCRILTATNANLEELVKKKRFRKDLLYRLNQVEIILPCLRDRKDDILLLVQYFMNNEFCHKTSFSSEAKDALESYSWPGNVRELKNMMENLKLFSDHKVLYELEDLDVLVKDAYQSRARKKDISSQLSTKDLLHHDLSKIQHINENKSQHSKRIQRIKSIFENSEKVFRSELIELLGSSPKTITSDLKKLIDERYIIKIQPTPSPRSVYFILNNND